MSFKAWTDTEIVEEVTNLTASIDGDERALIAVVGERAAIIVTERADIQWLYEVCQQALEALPEDG